MSAAASPDRPTICLTMIVRDEAHIVHEALDSAAPHIDRWVIVDTGSTDDTPGTIQRRMAVHGIPGELHHRPWRDFGTNRTEAMRLADGQADYLWVLDADDLVIGHLDLSELTSDSYLLRYRTGNVFWRRQIFRSGLPWRYEGVLHEYPVCDAPATEARLDGDYEIHGRTMGARSADPQKYARDAALLRGVLERDPGDLRALFYLGQSLADAGQDAEAAEVFAARAAAGGWDEERCHALLRRGDLLARLGRPWAESREAYLAAFDARPSRAEPLVRIARHHREVGEYELGYEYARRADAMPYPTADNLFVDASVYAWAARDERAVCAHHLGRHEEALDLCTTLLAGTALPEEQRERVAANRDGSVEPARLVRASHPVEVVEALTAAAGRPGPPDADVTVTLRAHDDLEPLERTLDSFLQCCEDLDRVARFVCLLDTPHPARAQAVLERYPFLEVVRGDRAAGSLAGAMNRLLTTVATPLWLHLEAGWELFARGPLIGRAARILAADETLGQVAFNRSYARGPWERALVGGEVRVAGDLRLRRHVHVPPDGAEWARFQAGLAPGERTNAHWPHFTVQPSLIDVARLRTVGPFADAEDPERAFGERYTARGLRTAFFDEVTALLPHAGEDDGPPDALAASPVVEVLPGVRAGELVLELDPPWPVTSSSIAAAGEELRLTLRTEIAGKPPRDHVASLDAALRVVALEAAPADAEVLGPREVPGGGGRLRLEDDGSGTAWLTLAREGEQPVRSAPFSLTGDRTARPFGLAAWRGLVVLAFGLDGGRVGLAVVEEREVEALLTG